MHTIDEHRSLSPEAFDQYVRQARPVIVRGAARDWTAVSRWEPAYLRERVGEVRVPMRRTPAGAAELDDSVDRGMHTLADILDECARHPDRETYVPGFGLRKAPILAEDVELPAFLVGQPVNATTVFLGQHTRGFGHLHPRVNALLCQVVGHKRMTLYAPEDLPNLYMRPAWSGGFWRSRVNFHDLDAARFPRLANATGLVAELEPGDALFIPLHWLHVPTGGPFSVSVTSWWPARVRELRSVRAAAHSAVGMGATAGRMVAHRVRHMVGAR